MTRYKLFLLLLMVSIMTCGARTDSPKREVRAVWLTTIGGLDWPHTKAYDEASILRQQQELCRLLDQLKAAHFNTVLLQTRIRSTVIYPSAIEPWDDCLTGHAGKNPGYDPLAFAIEACHKRGMELHAWVVAFPGNSQRTAAMLGRQALQRRQPRLCIKTDQGWMLDPGIPETADYLTSICSEITDHYDIDGIHLDYIRYPEKEVHFNDARTYRHYGKGENQAEWRRDNVTRCVREIYKAVKVRKPWVRLSCSPIGKRDDLNRYSSRGWNAYTTVHQDAEGWLREGIMDMLVPMMYFEGNHFYPFAFDWMEQSSGRIIVPGLGAYLMADPSRNWPLSTLERENAVLRSIHAGGQAYFRSQFVTENTKGLYRYLKNTLYAEPALTPALTWQKATSPQAPGQPRLKETQKGFLLSWTPAVNSPADSIYYNVYRSNRFPVDITRAENLLETKLQQTELSIDLLLPATMLPYYAVTAMDRYGNESPAIAFNFPCPASQPVCTGQLRMEDGLLVLPPSQAEYLMLTDQADAIAVIQPYTERPDLSRIAKGLYTVRTLEKKGVSHCLGKFFNN